jgi:hypothetical protein
VGAWEIDGTTVDYGVGEGIVAPVPYSSTPSYTQHLITQPEGCTKYPRYGYLFTHEISGILGLI